MLAQNFKTPAELKISDAEFDALYKVLGMLERGEMVHELVPSRPEHSNGFNMAIVHFSTECGTACCIYGWAQQIYPRFNPNMSDAVNIPLYDLFCVHGRRSRLQDITPAQAAIALRSYLTCGDPKWDEALA